VTVEGAVPEWDELGEVAQALLLELAGIFHSRMEAKVRFTVHDGGVRDVRVEVDLRKASITPRCTRTVRRG
jgi:hypothetical protein